jgi:hypothetical protein
LKSFKNPIYTKPVISKHCNDLKKDWYVFFEYSQGGKIYKFKKREGVNRVKELTERIEAIKELRKELERNLYFGWNPITDPQRVWRYNPYLTPNTDSPYTTKKEEMRKAAFLRYYNKH